MQPDFERTAAAMTDGAMKAITAAVAPLLKRIEALEAISPQKGEPGDRGLPGEPGRDGVGVAGAVIDRAGVLVLTLTDGTTRDLGMVVGKDGANGNDGAPGANGNDGEAGRDGFSLDAFDIEAGDDGRTVTLKFEQGETRHAYELVFPVAIYRGVFKEGEEYTTGDMVTWGGSLWHCDEPTKAKPDTGGWRLAVKKGRDGKDGKAA